MLRIWLEDGDLGKTGWRGRVQHVNSGDIRYFRDWSTLECFVEEQIFQPGASPDAGESPDTANANNNR